VLAMMAMAYPKRKLNKKKENNEKD